MAKKRSDPDASASIDGSLAQFDYALLLLAQGDHGRVGIETLDDVAAESAGKGTQRIQLKQSLAAKGYSITLRSLPLWKTLAIWADAVSADNSILNTNHFVLVATRVGTAEPISKLTQTLSEEDCEAMATALLKEAESATDDLADAMGRVKTLGKPLLKKLLTRVSLRQQAITADATALKQKLQVPGRINPDRVIEGLRGWIVSVARKAWGEHSPCWIEQSAFNTRKHELFKSAELELKAVRAWHKVTDNCDPTTVAENSMFLRQLRLVGADREELQEAVIDLLKHRTERHRLTSLGETDDDDFRELEEALVRNWQPKWKTMRDGKPASPRTAGLTLYRDVLLMQPPQLTSDLRIHQPFCRGGYQFLANDRHVGWHPAYKEMLENDDTGGGGDS